MNKKILSWIVICCLIVNTMLSHMVIFANDNSLNDLSQSMIVEQLKEDLGVEKATKILNCGLECEYEEQDLDNFDEESNIENNIDFDNQDITEILDNEGFKIIDNAEFELEIDVEYDINKNFNNNTENDSKIINEIDNVKNDSIRFIEDSNEKKDMKISTISNVSEIDNVEEDIVVNQIATKSEIDKEDIIVKSTKSNINNRNIFGTSDDYYLPYNWYPEDKNERTKITKISIQKGGVIPSGEKYIIDNGNSLEYYLSGSEIIIYGIDATKEIYVGDTEKSIGIFKYFKNLEEIENICNLNTSRIINMSYMFSYCSSLKSLNLSSFSTNKVTTL